MVNSSLGETPRHLAPYCTGPLTVPHFVAAAMLPGLADETRAVPAAQTWGSS